MEIKAHHSKNLVTELKRLVAEERRMTTRILELLRHVDEGRWFLEMGYSSLFDFCVRELGYAQDAANRRISAMRLMRDVPALKSKIESGTMNLSVVTEASRFLRAEKRSGVSRTLEQKRELVLALEGKSKREAERALLSHAQPQTLLELQKVERSRAVTPELTRVSLVISKEQEAKVEKLKGLLSHRNPAGSVAGLLDILLDEALEKHDPARIAARRSQKLNKSDTSPRPVGVTRASHSGTASAAEGSGDGDLITCAPSAPSAPHPATRQHSVLTAGPLLRPSPFCGGPAGGLDSDGRIVSRYIPAEVKRAVWLRDGGKCTYENCGSTHFIQYDHRVPFALGGVHTADNLRLLCAAHNKAESEKVFGPYQTAP